MARLIDYNVSVPAVVTNQVAIVVPQTPAKVILAELGIFVQREFHNNRVELSATVGSQGTSGTPTLLFRVFRGNQEIYYGAHGLESALEHFGLITFQVIDINVAPGAHGYSLYVENLDAGTTAQVNLSAAVYAV
ncbi:exosporium protein C [Paenibacillus sp. R14(2021)]|uniref:exosporium protein C n=1 Tax=Paenibacillus sp. R14(2021) TaxID=2859228 RepID=UPI001C61182E|nr:exosporium protein C [Paenibacillus sp. R14(2021)]